MIEVSKINIKEWYKMSKVLDVVRGLNSIINQYKHPMYNVDERCADVHFANMDTTTTFTQAEVDKIYSTVMSACEVILNYSEDGRPQPLEVFFKCYINSEGKATWNIYKNGMVVITIVFNTRPTAPETYNMHLSKPLPPSMDFDMLKSPVVKVSDSDMGSWIRRSYNGSSIVLNSDMNAFHKVLKCYTDCRMVDMGGNTDYDVLMTNIPTNAKLFLDARRNPHIEFYFKGTMAIEPTYIFCPFPSRGIIMNEHEMGVIMGVMMKEQFAELKEWVDNYYKPSVIDVTKY